MQFSKYKQNLRVEGNAVYSYNTHVADIVHAKSFVVRRGWWSTTTSKHINYVARELGYEVVDGDKEV